VSDQQPATPPGNGRPSLAVSILLFAIGVILLLPGLCSLFFLAAFLSPGQGGGGDPGIWSLLMLCLLIGAGGVALIVHAIRRRRRP
jgi:hypothetical protein